MACSLCLRTVTLCILFLFSSVSQAAVEVLSFTKPSSNQNLDVDDHQLKITVRQNNGWTGVFMQINYGPG